MKITGKHLLLTALAGVLLGVLGVLLLRSAAAPETPPPALSAPAPTGEPASAPATAPPETPAPSTSPAPPVDEALRAFLGEEPGRWSLAYQPLPEGEPILVASDREPMVSASLIKLFIMGAVYERLESGELERDAVWPLLSAMITYSDNASANTLTRMLGGGDEAAGMAAVNDWCARQGYAQTRMNRLMLADNGLQNYTGAEDCARFLAAVYRGDCVSPAASREMLELLLAQTVNDRLPARLPEGTRVAHKTGDLSGLCCADVGIVFSPGGDYILCLICNDQDYDLDARDAEAELSAKIYGLANP